MKTKFFITIILGLAITFIANAQSNQTMQKTDKNPTSSNDVQIKYDNVSKKFQILDGKTGNLISEYDVVWGFSQAGVAKVNTGGELNIYTKTVKGGKYGFIDKTGKEIVPVIYDQIYNFCEGFAVVNIGCEYNYLGSLVGGKCGIIDETGKEIVPPKYDNVRNFSGGIAAVQQNGKWGFVDKSGKEIIPVKYDYIKNFSGRLAVQQGGKWYLLDKTGLLISEYDVISDNFSDDLAIVARGHKGGFIDRKGKEVIPVIYAEVKDFQEETGWAPVKLVEKWGFIDKTGKMIIPFRYDDIQYFYNDLAAAKLGGKWGFIDKTGKEIIFYKYDDILIAYDDLVAVKLEGKWGFIDKTTGKVLIPIIYKEANSFTDGKALVSDGKRYFYIDRKGKETY